MSKSTQFPRYIWAMIIFAFGIFIFIQVINVLHSSTESVKSASVNFPFVLSLEPPVISPGSTVNITLNTTQPNLVNSSLSLFVIYPDSHYIKIADPIIGPHQFPPIQNSKQNQLPNGKYTVVLTDITKNRNIMSVAFNVTTIQWYDQIYQFLQVGSLAAFIPFLIPVAGFSYSFLSGRWEARARAMEAQIENKRKELEEEIANKNRILQEKSKWILSNIKTLMKLVGGSNDCLRCFTITCTQENKYSISIKDEDISTVLFQSIKFLEAKENFEKELNIWYFDDAKAEYFLILLWDEIIQFYSMVCPLERLREFYNNNLNDLRENNHFNAILRTYEEVLDLYDVDYGIPYSSKLFLLHYVFSEVMNISINNDLLVTYSSPSKLVEQYKYYFEKKSNRDSYLIYAVNILNNHFYGNESNRYYIPSLGNTTLA